VLKNQKTGDLYMKTESVADFLARGGKVEESTKETSLDQLLYNEGLLDHKDAEAVKKNLNDALSKSLDQNFAK
jgi:hypothetical protein